MQYLNDQHLTAVGIDWHQIVSLIAEANHQIYQEAYAQPIKPYLRWGDLKNRIIAMPGYLGGDQSVAGIKWIASFPDNINHQLPRAHSITLLNDTVTGKPYSIINASLISGIRTAGVSGALLVEYLKWQRAFRPNHAYTVGILGFGPIGQLHLEMVEQIMEDQIDTVHIYDPRPIDEDLIPDQSKSHIKLVSSWREAYRQADIFITCTTSPQGYIDEKPLAGSLQLNVSLRDYLPDCRKFMDVIIVDNWNEVCRENTDIEMMFKYARLKEEDTYELPVALNTKDIEKQLTSDAVVMFNPMGMAVFDMAVAHHYSRLAAEQGEGIALP